MGIREPDMAISHAVDPGLDTSYRRDESRPEVSRNRREEPERARDYDLFEDDWGFHHWRYRTQVHEGRL